MKKVITILLFIMAALPLKSFAVVDTVTVPATGVIGIINTTIEGDTLADGSRVNPDRVYKLIRSGLYYLNGALTVKAGTHIQIVGEPKPATGTDLGPAVLQLGAVTGVYYNNNFNCYGNITLKNLWLFYVDNAAAQYWCTLSFQGDNLKGVFDNCIFDWSQAPAITVNGLHFVGRFNNCYFRNDVDPSQWWAGRMLYFLSGTSGDTVWCENNTFANQGFAFQPEDHPQHRVYFNHNTFLNIAKFSLQHVTWTWVILTNNLFVNTHFTGERVSDRVGQDPHQQLYGTFNVDTLNSPVDGVSDANRVAILKNNAYFVDPAFAAFYQSYNDTVPPTEISRWILPEPFMNQRAQAFFDGTFPHANMKNINFIDGTDPGFTVAATNVDSINAFLKSRYGMTNGANVNWGFHYDLNALWPLAENLAYSDATLKTAARGGLPLGDLNWFPTQLASWSSAADWADAQTALSVSERKGTGVPTGYSLNQNYPNPFNPSTQITYSVPTNGYVTLKVYNLVGQEVSTLFAGVQHAGNYQVTFDASSLTSGVYFYRLETGNTSISKKMILMK
jgi:hypothetical protein